MSTIIVSVIVTRDTDIVSSELERVEVPFFSPTDAIEFWKNVRDWVSFIPVPGRELTLEPPDTATELAAQLTEILTPRDSRHFYPEDREGIASMAEARPYDFARSVLR